MISFEEALSLVLKNAVDFGTVSVPLNKANGRILAEPIFTDRDFPPFNRATKDGIAINYKSMGQQQIKLKIQAIAAAGSPQLKLHDNQCIEIMTGAIVPENADTVVMYEHLKIVDGLAILQELVKQGQNIHLKGSDEPKGAEVLKIDTKITAAEIGVLASVGKSTVLVRKKPKVCLVSTGDELVDVDEIPEPHQIRKSNSHTLRAALLNYGIASDMAHIADDKNETKQSLLKIMEESDVVLLSGGVSKGKYDYLPDALNELGVVQVFHRVKQRPGKPFWFGKHEETQTTFFAFPGNPASTFANFHVYFHPWINKCFGLMTSELTVTLGEAFENTTNLTRFISVKVTLSKDNIEAALIHGNGSGDLTSLTKSNGFVRLEPNKKYNIGQKVPFIPTRSMM